MTVDNFFDFIKSDVLRGFVLLAGVIVATISVLTARIIARRKQTIDALIAGRTDDKLNEGFSCFAEIHEKDDANLRSFAKKANWNKPETDKFQFILNHWEYTAIGIRMGIYDDDMFRIARRSSVLSLYGRAKPFIDALREETKREMLYIEFETMVERWKKVPLRKPPTGFMWWLTYLGYRYR